MKGLHPVSEWQPRLAGAFDDNYVWPWIVHVYSMYATGQVHERLLGDVPGALSDSNRSILERVSSWLDISIRWADIRLPDGLHTSGYTTALSYARLAFADTLEFPFFWLDADTILLSGWEEILTLPRVPNGMVSRASIEELDETSLTSANEARIQAGSVYFNAGVMELDPQLWRSHSFDRQWPILATEYHSRNFQFHDQDILNFLLSGLNVGLPPKFNFRPPFKNNSSDEPVILHFSTRLKPWLIPRSQRTRLFCSATSTPYRWYAQYWNMEQQLIADARRFSGDFGSNLESLRVHALRAGFGIISRAKGSVKARLLS